MTSEQLRNAARAVLAGGIFDREATAALMIRAAQQLDDLEFTLGQWRKVYEGDEQQEADERGELHRNRFASRS